MPTRWEVERALLRSQLEPSARLIVFALLSRVDNDTAIVPAERSPSLTDLQGMTGMSRSALAEWLTALEDAGWVARARPAANTKDVPTAYTLAVGAVVAERRARKRVSSPPSGLLEAESTDQDVSGFSSPPSGLVRPADHSSSPLSGTAVVRQANSSSPPSGPTLLPIENSPTESSKPSTTPRRRKAEQPPRPDVDRICTHLADWIERNGSKRPSINESWRDAGRLMIDRDGRTEEQITRAIDWCQHDEFWRSNILSMPKLREKYDQLRLAAQRTNSSPSSNNRAPARNAWQGLDEKTTAEEYYRRPTQPQGGNR